MNDQLRAKIEAFNEALDIAKNTGAAKVLAEKHHRTSCEALDVAEQELAALLTKDKLVTLDEKAYTLNDHGHVIFYNL
jgi:hypothetical protein